MPIRSDERLGLTSRRNVPQIDVIKMRAKNASDLIDATLEASRVIVFTERSPEFWQTFETSLSIPADRGVEVVLEKPEALTEFETGPGDMVLVDRHDPSQATLTDEKLAETLQGPNLSAAAYRGIWPDYQATSVLGLPALAQRVAIQAGRTAEAPGR